MKDKIGIIIQARSLSTRLPNKLFLPFYKKDRIIDILLRNISRSAESRGIDVILATSLNSADSIFEPIAKENNIFFFRGNENDVLDRFIKAAETFGIKDIVRVCADNPIYDIERTLDLIDFHIKEKNDYTAFQLKDGLPSIKSHLGFWGEIVSLKALNKVINSTKEKLHREHVTNYIYEHSSEFKIQFKNAPSLIFNRKDIRLTVDTKEDFILMQEIYKRLIEEKHDLSIESIVKFLDENNNYLISMAKNIKKNTK